MHFLRSKCVRYPFQVSCINFPIAKPGNTPRRKCLDCLEEEVGAGVARVEDKTNVAMRSLSGRQDVLQCLENQDRAQECRLKE